MQKNLKNDWNPGTWVLFWSDLARAFQWIPTWQGLKGFQRFHQNCQLDFCVFCAFDVSCFSIERVKVVRSNAGFDLSGCPGGIHALKFVRLTQDWLSFIIWDRPKTDQNFFLKSIPEMRIRDIKGLIISSASWQLPQDSVPASFFINTFSMPFQRSLPETIAILLAAGFGCSCVQEVGRIVRGSQWLPPLTLMLLVANYINTKWCKKTCKKIPETLTYWYLSESSQWELFNEYQHDRV